MEEILASIRRIISEDGEEGQAYAGAEDELLDEKAGDDVLELTDVVDDEPDAVEEEAPVDVFGDFQIETDQASGDRKSTRLNSSNYCAASMPSSARKEKTKQT